jgi:hypothetical protein
MPNKVTNAINHFTSKGTHPTPAAEPSVAEALGLNAPAPSQEQLAGIRLEAALARKRTAALEAQEKFLQERRDYQQKKEDALWKQILARQTVT